MMRVDVRQVLLLALRDLRRAWPQFLVTYVAYRAVASAILIPLAGLTLQAFLALSGRSVVADEDILRFA